MLMTGVVPMSRLGGVCQRRWRECHWSRDRARECDRAFDERSHARDWTNRALRQRTPRTMGECGRGRSAATAQRIDVLIEGAAYFRCSRGDPRRRRAC